MESNSNGFREIMEVYNKFMKTKSDPRTSNWLLMSSPGPLITILVTYLYFCISAGPRYMKDKKPYDLKLVIQAYNALQIVLSIYLVYLGMQGGWARGYSFHCQPVDYSLNPTAITMASGVWLYFITKIIELVDTVFFVLRKKTNQVSFLHLYHHTMMPICGWIGTRFLPDKVRMKDVLESKLNSYTANKSIQSPNEMEDIPKMEYALQKKIGGPPKKKAPLEPSISVTECGHGTLLGVINSFIHIIMYSYYLLASLGPNYQKYLWWKKYLTAMQMVQFCIIFLHNAQVLFRDCNYPKIIAFLLSTQAVFFLYLFGSFYHRSYVQARKWREGKLKKPPATLNSLEDSVPRFPQSVIENEKQK